MFAMSVHTWDMSTRVETAKPAVDRSIGSCLFGVVSSGVVLPDSFLSGVLLSVSSAARFVLGGFSPFFVYVCIGLAHCHFLYGFVGFSFWCFPY